MLPLVSLPTDDFPKRHSQAFARLKSIIELDTEEQPNGLSKSLTLNRFQNLITTLEEKYKTTELVYGLKAFSQTLEREIVDVRKALLYLKRLPLTEFSEELCKYSGQVYPTFEKQIIPTYRYTPFDLCHSSNNSESHGVNESSLGVVLNEISQERVSWQYNQCLDYIARLKSEVSFKKRILEKFIHEIDRLSSQTSLSNQDTEEITLRYVGQKVIHLFKNHEGLLQELSAAIRKIEKTYSVHFHPYVILHVLISAIHYRQHQLSSFLLDKNYNWIEKMASDIQETVQTTMSFAHRAVQQYDKLLEWREKLLNLYIDKKKQICKVRSSKHLFNKSPPLQEETSTCKLFSELQELTSETAQTAQQFLSHVRNLIHQVDESLSGSRKIHQHERGLLIQLITDSFDVARATTDTTNSSTDQSLIVNNNTYEQLEFNSRDYTSSIHEFELEHQDELGHLIHLIQTLDVQGKVLAIINEVVSSWIQPSSQYSEGL